MKTYRNKADIVDAINDGRARLRDIPARYHNSRVWVVGTGFVGCLYDNFVVFTTKRAAIKYAREIIAERETKGVSQHLTKHGIAPLNDRGTEYVEVSCNTVSDAIS